MKGNDAAHGRGAAGCAPTWSLQVHAVEALLAAGADVSIGEKDGYTPMHGAGFQGRAKVAKLLAAAGVDVNDVHADGYAPIHRACWGTQQRHAETVEAMLALGATLADRAACRAAADGSNAWTAGVVTAHFAQADL